MLAGMDASSSPRRAARREGRGFGWGLAGPLATCPAWDGGR